MMQRPRTLETVEDWIAMLRAIATPGMPLAAIEIMRKDGPGVMGLEERQRAAEVFIAGFADGVGNRRRVDRPLLAQMLGVKPGEMPKGDSMGSLDPEERAWWSLHDELVRDELVRGSEVIDWDANGPLYPALRDRGIEWWSQAELCGVHALSWRGLNDADGIDVARVRARVDRCCMWLIAEVQPDNATQHPWGVHLFAKIAMNGTRGERERSHATHYAQTLVHNAMVGSMIGGKIDTFAACILWNCAQWLEAAGG